jgi:hypothetical protein
MCGTNALLRSLAPQARGGSLHWEKTNLAGAARATDVRKLSKAVRD